MLDVGEVEGVTEADERANEKRNPLARDREQGEQQVSGNANSCHGNMEHDGVRAVVHESAVPVFVDGAGRGAGGVVNLKSQRGNNEACQGQQSENVSHRAIIKHRGQVPGREVRMVT